MKSYLIAGMMIFTLLSYGQVMADEVSQQKPASVLVRPPAPPKYHAKTLFRYPNEHTQSIVTYTKQDLEKVREERLMRDLSSSSATKKSHTRFQPLASN